MMPREVCHKCGIDAGSGPYCHTTPDGCIKALKDKHRSYRSRVNAMIKDKLEEVKNHIGGVIGYRLHLSAEETDTLLREIENG